MNSTDTPVPFQTYIVVFAIGFLCLGLFIILLSMLFNRRQIRNREEKQKMQSDFSRTLLESQLEIREQTLKYVGQELHDNLGQIASLIKINLNTIRIKDDPDSSEKMENTRALLRNLITDIKILSVSLGAEKINQDGLTAALQLEIDRMNATGQFVATFETKSEISLLTSDRFVIVYRMVQEVLNNIIKHSQSPTVAMTISEILGQLVISIRDEGIGFDPEEKLSGGGAGLNNLRKRADMIGAQLTIESKPGQGCITIITIPKR